MKPLSIYTLLLWELNLVRLEAWLFVDQDRMKRICR